MRGTASVASDGADGPKLHLEESQPAPGKAGRGAWPCTERPAHKHRFS